MEDDRKVKVVNPLHEAHRQAEKLLGPRFEEREKSLQEQMTALPPDQKIDMVMGLLINLGYASIKHDEKKGKHVLRFRD